MLPVSLTLHASPLPSQSPDSQYDSYLTIGIDGPAQTPGALSSIGLDFDAWSETEGIDTNNSLSWIARRLVGAVAALSLLLPGSSSALRLADTWCGTGCAAMWSASGVNLLRPALFRVP